MFKNYILTALRNIWKHKFFAGINIVGLSLSMSVCLVLILLVSDHFQYDKFHPNGDRIYRILSFTKGEEGPFDEGYATSPLRLKEQLVTNYTFAENGTNLNSYLRGEIRSPHKIFEVRSLYADREFFNVFGFEIKDGSQSPLDEPFSIVLSETMADKLFPNENPIGQTVEFEDHGAYKVTAVVTDPNNSTHLDIEVLASLSTLPVLQEKELVTGRYLEWENVWSNYNYILLNDVSSREIAEATINKIASENLQLDSNHPGYVFKLQALHEIVPGRLLSNEIKFALPWFILAFFGFLGLIVIITATINYTNLSIAKSLSRAREIGIRKINGARRFHIIWQFLVESIVIAFVSLLFAIIMYKLLIKSFNEIEIFAFVGIQLQDSWQAYLYFLSFTLGLGLLTGIGPSLFLSKMEPIKSLKGSLNRTQRKSSVLRFFSGKRMLLGIQFSLSIIMIVTIFTIKSQADFLVESDYGFAEDEIFFIEIQGHDPDIIREEFGSIAGIDLISFTSHHPAVGRSHGSDAFWKPDQEPINLYHFSVDPQYLEVMELELVAGVDFQKDLTMTNEKFILLNERAVDVFGFESASQATGEIVTVDSIRLTVVGVVKDYHWDPLLASIRPLGLRIIPEDFELAYFRLTNFNTIRTKKLFEDKWNEFDPAREFRGGFLNAELDRFYIYFYDLGGILGYVALLAVAITSLGFLGLVSFELKTRVKEMGIRKVLGANFRELTLTMSKGFLGMIIITTLIAFPLAVWINFLWVNNMAFHAPMGISSVLPALVILGTICLTTILSQVWINVRKNSLRDLES